MSCLISERHEAVKHENDAMEECLLEGKTDESLCAANLKCIHPGTDFEPYGTECGIVFSIHVTC
jgi:hypothetical protein